MGPDGPTALKIAEDCNNRPMETRGGTINALHAVDASMGMEDRKLPKLFTTENTGKKKYMQNRMEYRRVQTYSPPEKRKWQKVRKLRMMMSVSETIYH